MPRNVTTILAALLIAVALSARAQSPRPQFEVASVKVNNSSTEGSSMAVVLGDLLLRT